MSGDLARELGDSSPDMIADRYGDLHDRALLGGSGVVGPGHSATGRRSGSDSSTKAGDRTRTGDPQLGKLMLYQLSYARNGR